MSRGIRVPLTHCAFCGVAWGAGSAARSNEHVLAQWMRTLAGVLPSQRSSVRLGFELNEDADAYRELETVRRVSNSSIMNQRTRKVCVRCNTGWMSQLEEQARPTLVMLHRAAAVGDNVALDARQVACIARWAQKTMLTDELAADGSWIGLPEDRTTLMEGQPIRRSMVWLGRHASDFGVVSGQLRFAISDNYIPAPDDVVRAALLYTLSFNQLAIAVYLPEVRGREWPDPPITQWTRLWPLRRDFVFSTMEAIDHGALRQLLTDHRGWLPLTAVSRFERFPLTADAVGLG